MNQEIAYSLLEYIESLDDTNKNLLRACGAELHGHASHTLRKVIFNIVQEIPRLIPYGFDQKNHVQIITKRDGLMEYRRQIDYLESDYEQLLHNNYDFLDKIRRIRNTYEHQMHKNKLSSSGSGNLHLFDIQFKVDNAPVSVCADDFINLMKELNILFAKLVGDINTYAQATDQAHHYLYRRAGNIDFLDFNTIYDSDLLHKIGKMMK